MAKLDELITAVAEGKNKLAVTMAEELVQAGVPVRAIIQDGLTAALTLLDLKCTSAEFNLLELILAGRAMVDVMDKVVEPRLPESIASVLTGPAVVLGTIKGDIHDLGKHIVHIVLKAAGYRVFDLGKDVEPALFVQTARAEKADFILVSSLLTVSIPYVRQIRELCQKTGISARIVAGGAALQQARAEDLAVDYVAMDVFDGLHYLNEEAGMEL